MSDRYVWDLWLWGHSDSLWEDPADGMAFVTLDRLNRAARPEPPFTHLERWHREGSTKLRLHAFRGDERVKTGVVLQRRSVWPAGVAARAVTETRRTGEERAR